MKSLSSYIVLIAFTVLSLWVAFTWNIPVDNQIAMAFMGVASFSLFIMLVIYDIKEYVKNQKNRPQTF